MHEESCFRRLGASRKLRSAPCTRWPTHSPIGVGALAHRLRRWLIVASKCPGKITLFKPKRGEKFMKSMISTMVVAGVVMVGSQAMAQDSPTASQSKDQMMKDCMAKQKATNSSMTQEAMETVCKNQIEKKQKDGNDLATGPQANKPQN